MAGIDDVTARGCIAIEWRAELSASCQTRAPPRPVRRAPSEKNRPAQTPLGLGTTLPAFASAPGNGAGYRVRALT